MHALLLVWVLTGCAADPQEREVPRQVQAGPSGADIDGGSITLGVDSGPSVVDVDAGNLDSGTGTRVPDGSLVSAVDASTPVNRLDAGSYDAGSYDAGSYDAGSYDAGSYKEVFDQGLAKYVGKPQLKETSVTIYGDGPTAIDVHHFSGKDRGPLCMYGDEFFVESRKGSSDTLMIFLQGGGVCLSEICAATPSPTLSLQLFDLAALLGIGGVLDPNNADNPTKDFDVVNAPYCDGSLFAGDVDRPLSDGNPDNGNQDPAYQRGLQNLTATVETAHRLFPNPPRIVLMGSSGGAYGVLAGTVMIRYFYPDTPLLVISDSGAPIVNGVDKGFITRSLAEFHASDLIPKSCPDCVSNGHATGVLEWALRIDPKLNLAYMTHARDHVIGEFFMQTTADQFQTAVVAETDRLLRSFPGRAFRYVIPSARHTLTMGLDDWDDGLQSTFLGIGGSFGVGFVGDDVSSEELSTWSLGGMRETGLDASGKSWTGYAWLKSLLENPANTPSVLQLK